MAITLFGTGCHQLYQKATDKKGSAKEFMATGKIMTGLDIFLGISAVVLGILALVGILPIPQSMVEPFSYGAIISGALNGILAIFMKCCASRNYHPLPIEHGDKLLG